MALSPETREDLRIGFRNFLWMVGGLVFVSGCTLLFGDKIVEGLKQIAPEKKPDAIMAKMHEFYDWQIVDAYAGNEVAADEDMKGKWCIIIGKAREVKKDIFGNAYVMIGGKYGMNGIQCYFDDNNSKQLVDVVCSNEYKISGKIEGKSLNVVMRRCKIVPDGK